MHAHHSRRRLAQAGFTLVEVLVALLIMAILAALSWQGLDGILRAREASRDSIDATVRLTTVLTQWEQDLQAVYDTGIVPAISYDGMSLRLTRRTDAGVMLVAWAVRGGLWQRWTAPVATRSGELQENWLRSQQLLGTEVGHLTVAENASQWQIYFNRGGQWTNPQSTGDLVQTSVTPMPSAPAASAPDTAGSAPAGAASAASAPVAATVQTRDVLPDAVRMQITLGGRLLTRDISLGANGS